jgi:LmbE family N-acetylglucosaminyl deacetylase
MKKLLPVAVLLFILGGFSAGPGSQAQVQEAPENKGAAAAWRALIRLRSTATALQVTAHPDDEDGAMLAWLSRGAGARTGLLTLNRGEGGANLIGPELYDALGIVRTEELLAAGKYYGVDQMFTRVTDFGFSKRLDETLEHWGKPVVLGDAVHAVRLYRPDVILARFHGKPRDGHGNHQSAGLIAAEVYEAAADPNQFPEHFKEGLRPWQPKKLYRSVRENEPYTVRVDAGSYDPLTGKSYRETARDGLSFQRSQGAGQVRAAAGSSFSSWMLVVSTLPKKEKEEGIFDGIDVTISGLAKLAGPVDLSADLRQISDRVEAAIKKFDARQPWTVATDLSFGQAATRKLMEKIKTSSIDAAGKDQLLFLLGNKEREFNDAMNKALGVAMEVLVDPEKPAEGPMSFFMPRETFNVAIPGQQFSVTWSVVNRSPALLEKGQILVVAPTGWETKARRIDDKTFKQNVRVTAQFDLKVPADAPYTRPYWSRASELRDHIYRIDKPESLHLPFAPPEATGVFHYEVEGVRFTMTAPVQTVYIDRPWGEQRRLLTVAPAVNVGISPRVGAVPVGADRTSFNVQVNVGNNVKGNAEGKVKLRLPDGWSAKPVEQTFKFTHEGEAANFDFQVTAPRASSGSSYKIQATAELAGREYTEGYSVITHRDNEPRHLYRPAVMEVRGVDVKVAPNLTVGYVMGVGDEIPKALEQIGVKVRMLNETDLATGNLNPFDAILIGIRATAVREDLKTYSKRLLEYAERGGNLVYQYQTPEFDDAPYGPFPYKLTPRAEEVSEEDSTVTILDPSNPIFNFPNKITASDFNGWVEERGSKWMTTWDERYKPLLECHDRQQPPQKGGLMLAQYGKGTFVYAAYAFYRQLPAGVEGGYRLFANIISLKKR